jgi:superfamily II DNA or RNA helicase
MTEKVIILAKDETYVKISCERSIAQEISDYFTFYVPGYKFTPSYKNKIWDGKIRLFNLKNYTIYKGLLYYIQKFCEDREYECIVEEPLNETSDVSLPELQDTLDNLKHKPREDQLRAIAHALRNNRSLILSPTGSGKSFIIYCILKYLLERNCQRALIIVPTVSLVHQMETDFKEYSIIPGQMDYIHKIVSGQEKFNIESKIVVSTWQSIYKLPKNWFDQFDIVIGDEAHLFKASSLVTILSNLNKCKYRFGLTGTLDGTQTHKLVLEGLFGPVMKVIQTKDLIESKILSDFRIKALVLKYSENVCKMMKQKKYQEEIEFLISNPKRNNFIKNLTLSREGNTLLLFNLVEKHGKVLYDLICKDVNENRKVFFIHGGVSAEERENVRFITEKENNAIIVASYGTFSTGINIRNLHNVIFASPSKSRIRNLQSIGRGLRKGDNKSVATLYDIADNLTYKSYNNHTLKHFAIRIKMYSEEDFNYKIYNIRIEDV